MSTNSKVTGLGKLTLLGKTVSDSTINAVNSLLDVTGYVYGILNLVTPEIKLESQFSQDQNNYNQFRTNFSVYQGQAAFWIQPTGSGQLDIVSQISTLGNVLTGFTSTIISDLKTLKTLGPGISSDKTLLKEIKTLVSNSKAQVDSLISNIYTFETDVRNGNALMTQAYQGILSNVDKDLQTEINGLQTIVNNMNADIKAAQKKITKETIEEGISIAAIAVGTLTAVFGFGLAILAAGIAGLALTKEEIDALNEKIATDKQTIKTSFEAMSDDTKTKTAVELFQNNVDNSLEAQSVAMAELQSFSAFLSILEGEIEEVYAEITSLSNNTSKLVWEIEIDEAITAWNNVNALAVVLSKIKIDTQPIIS